MYQRDRDYRSRACLLYKRELLQENCGLDNEDSPASYFFFFNDTAPPEISTLPLHDPLPTPPSRTDAATGRRRSCARSRTRTRTPSPSPGRTAPHSATDGRTSPGRAPPPSRGRREAAGRADRKSTRLNSSHSQISYAVFCLKK